MADQNVKTKSILKKTRAAPALPPSIPVPKTDAEKRRLEVAVQHATLLQEQKKIQQTNLDAVEELSEYPTSSEHTEDEASRFLSLVTFFQPSDYDALIEERHANGRCAYTLCPNPPRGLDAKKSFLRPKGSQNWCSDDCAKKALYVKAQLDETPAWERRGGSSPSIVLRSEGYTVLNRPKQAETGDDQLAKERGETVKSTKPELVTSSIVENLSLRPKQPSAVRFDDLGHTDIEGYRVSSKRQDISDIAHG